MCYQGPVKSELRFLTKFVTDSDLLSPFLLLMPIKAAPNLSLKCVSLFILSQSELLLALSLCLDRLTGRWDFRRGSGEF